MERNQKRIGERFKQARKNAGYTQEQVAAKLDLSQSYIANIEGGKAWPSLHLFLDFCDLYHVTADSLLYDNLSTYEDQYDKECKAIFDSATEKERAYLINLLRSGLEAYRKS